MSTVDEFEELIDALLEADIFEPSVEGELRPSESFQRRRAEHRAAVEGFDQDELADALAEYATTGAVDPDEVGRRALGDAMAIHEAADAVDRERSLLAALALSRIESSSPAPGVPDGFLPIAGEDVAAFMGNHPAAIIYCWREDCPPCDGARESLEELLADGVITDSVGLGAVYGPDSPGLLREEYEVGVAPTTLFCVDGRIDSRIVGNPGPEAFQTEVEIITDSID